MKRSIKKQIMDALVESLQSICSPAAPCPENRARGVTRSLDPLASNDRLPWLYVYDGEEREIEQDNFGRTYEFALAIKLLVEGQDLAERKDYLVPEVQRVIESNRTILNEAGEALAINVEDGSEQPFIDELQKPIGGALLFYTVSYRRKLGDPYTTY